MEKLVPRQASKGRVATRGGFLLRSSRMFSLPKPLPVVSTLKAKLGERKSQSMTEPYPRYQSIISPLTSREKGDWGLKRPMPLRTRVSFTSPVLRIKHLDTSENVTDYGLANDHTRSLEKFQELNVAMVIPAQKHTRSEDANDQTLQTLNTSVFEENFDVTDFTDLGPRAERQGVKNGGKKSTGEIQDHKRWKYRSPFLGSMVWGDFLKYLREKVRPKRAEFMAMLRQRKAEEDTARQRIQARNEGKNPPPPVLAERITDKEMTEYMCRLREERFTLYDAVKNFFDLVPAAGVDFVTALFEKSRSPYSIHGPPPSHPSAGISYLRTKSYMDNHPVYGPQAAPEPALVRILRPRAFAAPACLGVGGFVAFVPSGNNDLNQRNSKGDKKKPPKGILDFDIETPGGGKAYVSAKVATVNPVGEIVLHLGAAKPESVLIHKENRGLASIYNQFANTSGKATPREMKGPASTPNVGWNLDTSIHDVTPSEPGVMSSSEAYGLGPVDSKDA